jgi:hypothetical protein
MSTIFDLYCFVLGDYRDFIRSFFLVADEGARAFLQRALEASRFRGHELA